MGDQSAAAYSPANSSVPKRAPEQRRSIKSPRENGSTGQLRCSRSLSITGDRIVKKLRLSRALTIPDTITVAEACRRMVNRRVDSALLTDTDALLCGIITDKDIASRVIAQQLPPETTIVSTVMTKNPVFVMSDTLAAEALQKMVQGKFRHLPVVEKGEVVAILDISKCLYDAIARMKNAAEKGNALAAAVENVERQWGNNLNASSSYLESLLDRIFRPTLASMITDTSKVAAVSSVDSIYTATKKMSDLCVSSVVITNKNKPLGIFTSKDVLMRVVAKNLDPGTTVDTVMSANPECATMDMTIVDALHTMHDKKCHHLPVVDQDGSLVACVDVLQLTHAAAAMVGNKAASAAGDSTSTMLQKFWDTAFALDPLDAEEDAHSDLSTKLVSENLSLDMGKISAQRSFGSKTPFLFKLEDKRGHFHRFSCGTNSLTELTSTIIQRIGNDPNHLEVPRVLYEDDEGDHVLLSSDSDLIAAVNFAKTSGWKGLRLYLDYPEQTNMELASTTTTRSTYGSTQTTMFGCAVAVIGFGLFLYIRKYKGDISHLLHWH